MKKPTRKKQQPKRVVKFSGINKSGTLPNGGKFRIVVGEIEISYSEK